MAFEGLSLLETRRVLHAIFRQQFAHPCWNISVMNTFKHSLHDCQFARTFDRRCTLDLLNFSPLRRCERQSSEPNERGGVKALGLKLKPRSKILELHFATRLAITLWTFIRCNQNSRHRSQSWQPLYCPAGVCAPSDPINSFADHSLSVPAPRVPSTSCPRWLLQMPQPRTLSPHQLRPSHNLVYLSFEYCEYVSCGLSLRLVHIYSFPLNNPLHPTYSHSQTSSTTHSKNPILNPPPNPQYLMPKRHTTRNH